LKGKILKGILLTKRKIGVDIIFEQRLTQRTQRICEVVDGIFKDAEIF
jgi:hypothetical protein